MRVGSRDLMRGFVEYVKILVIIYYKEEDIM
jgi:hypothetical protein